MNAVLTPVERGGKSRTFHVDGTSIADLAPVLRTNIAREAKLMTDSAGWYTSLGKEFASHETVKHSADEYVRGDVTTNTVEGFFSIFKRGMRGIYQHCDEKHLHRYLAEYEFRYNHRIRLGFDDMDRTIAAVKGAEGKRLTYRQPGLTGQ